MKPINIDESKTNCVWFLSRFMGGGMSSSSAHHPWDDLKASLLTAPPAKGGQELMVMMVCTLNFELLTKGTSLSLAKRDLERFPNVTMPHKGAHKKRLM